MSALQKYRFCFMAGLCAAGGSFFGKMPSFIKDNNLQLKEIPYLTQDLQSYGGKWQNNSLLQEMLISFPSPFM